MIAQRSQILQQDETAAPQSSAARQYGTTYRAGPGAQYPKVPPLLAPPALRLPTQPVAQPTLAEKRLAPPTQAPRPTPLLPDYLPGSGGTPLQSGYMSAPPSPLPVTPPVTPPVPRPVPIQPVSLPPALVPQPPAPTPPALVPPPPGAVTPWAPAPGQGAAGVTTQAVRSDAVPYNVNPEQSAATQQLMGRLQGDVQRQMAEPTVYDDALFKKAKDAAALGINQNFLGAQDSLDAELASRGLNFSSIAGQRNVDLATRKAQTLSGLDTQLLQDRAQALASGRSAAFNNAARLFGTQAGLEQQNRAEQRGERSYTDSLRNQAQAQAVQGDQNFQDIIARAMGYGTGGPAGAMLGSAASEYGQAADMYGGVANQSNQGLAALAQLAAQFYLGGQ